MMLRIKVLIYDGLRTSSEILEADGALRWAAWRHDGSEAIIVGNKGTILSYSPDSRVVKRIPSFVKVNLRCIEFSPDDRLAVIAGNDGTILTLSGSVKKVETNTATNLRRVAWRRNGAGALIAGNDGEAYYLTAAGAKRVYGARNHLRSISWHPNNDYAILVANSVTPSMAGLLPASAVYRFDTGTLSLAPLWENLPETPKDLTCASWRPDGSECLILGYDQSWNTSELYTFDGKSLISRDWKVENMLPTCFDWHPSGRYGVIVTGNLSRGGVGRLLKYGGGRPSIEHEEMGYSCTCVAWNPRGNHALILGSGLSRAFSA